MTSRTLVICMDDVGLEILGLTKTPNIDSLIKAGQSHTFWTQPVCSSSRACVFTGLLPLHSGVGGILRQPNGEELPHELVRLPKGLNAMIGKWHLAAADNPAHPTECGFDYFDGHLHNFRGASNYNSWPRVTATRVGGQVNVSVRTEKGYATREMTLSAIERMKDGYAQIFLSYAAIHKPLHTPEYGHDMKPSNDWEKSQAMLRALDFDIGMALEAALQLGYRILLYSDNGSARHAKGKKGTLYESGIRNLCVTYQWHQLPSNALIHAVDILPMIDGVMRPDSVAIGRRSVLYSEIYAPNFGEPFDDAWSWAARDSRWKLIQLSPAHSKSKKPENLLFDLSTDPDEQNSVLDEHADEARRLHGVIGLIYQGDGNA